MTLKLILSVSASLLLCISDMNAQTKKQMKALGREIQAEIKHENKLKEDALKGNIEAAYELGIIYFKGIHTSPNYDSAIKYLIIAQKGGSPAAMYKFGEMCQHGVGGWTGSNVENPNRSEAKAWYKHAADRGYQPAIDKLKQYQIADNHPVLSADSLITISHYAEALTLLKLASEYNYDSLAMYKIAQLYSNNRLTGYGEYSFWLSESAEHNYIPAIRELAYYYEKQGTGYEKDAMHWFYMAAVYGDSLAHKKYDAYYAKSEAEKRKAREGTYTLGSKPSYSAASPAPQAPTTETRKTCPICNGTGKVTSRSTSETRNWNNKTITMTDHVTSSPCSRCNGKGYYTY